MGYLVISLFLVGVHSPSQLLAYETIKNAEQVNCRAGK